MKPLTTAPLFLSIAFLLAAGPAYAAEPAPPVPAPTEPTGKTEWYGWQIGLLDGLSGLIYLSSFADGAGTFGRGVLGFTGTMTYAVGGAPHGRHGMGRTLLSMGLRVGAIVAAFSIAGRPDVHRDDFVVYLPALAVSVFDIAVLARDVPAEPVAAVTAHEPSLAWFAAPVAHGGLLLGVGSAF